MNLVSCNFRLKSYLWFQIELALRASILKSCVWFQPKLHSTQFNYHDLLTFRKFLYHSVHADMTVLITVRTNTNRWSKCKLGVIAADLTCLHSANSFRHSKQRHANCQKRRKTHVTLWDIFLSSPDWPTN